MKFVEKRFQVQLNFSITQGHVKSILSDIGKDLLSAFEILPSIGQLTKKHAVLKPKNGLPAQYRDGK